MRKLAWLAIILLIFFVVFLTLGLTNYMGVGESVGGFMHGSIIAPIRNFIVDGWLFIGTSGWYILATVVVIGMCWIPFYYIVIKGFFWNTVIQQKVLHNTPQTAPAYQSAPQAAIPITGLQSSPSQQTTPAPEQEKKTEQ